VGIWEFHVAVIATWLLLGWSWLSEERTPAVKRTVAGIGAMAVVLAIGSIVHHRYMFQTVIASARNFYGVLRARGEPCPPGDWRRSLAHGRVPHGAQHEIDRARPASYYSRTSGVGLALDRHPRRKEGAGLRVGAVGLGVGTVAAYAGAGDTFVF